MPKFKVGELCEVWSSKSSTWKECTITKIYPKGTTTRFGQPTDYEIEVPASYNRRANDYLWSALESMLRKKRPPTWEDVKEQTGWSPSKHTIHEVA